MEPWLDTLSEEWISQPGSSASPSVRDSPSPGLKSSVSSQSQIPRRKTQGRSHSDESEEKKSIAGKTKIESKRENMPLLERTSSELNTLGNTGSNPTMKYGIQNSKNSLPLAIHRRASMNSTLSTQSAKQGTVQYKLLRRSSPTTGRTKTTPEWRKAVLDGGGPARGQRDLFSPMELEGLFKPPNAPKEQKKSSLRKYTSAVGENIPSSPLPAPQNLSKRTQHVTDRTAQQPSPERRSLEIEEEKSAESAKEDILDSRPVESRQDLESEKLGLNSPQLRHADSSDPQLQTNDSPSLQSLKEDESNHDLSPGHTSINERRIVSSKSEPCHENMSLVSLSRLKLGLLNRDPPLPPEQGYIENKQSGLDSSICLYPAQSQSAAKEDEVPGSDPIDQDPTSQYLPDDLSMGSGYFAIHSRFVTMHRGGYSTDSMSLPRPLSTSPLPPSDAILEGEEYNEKNRIRTPPMEPLESPVEGVGATSLVCPAIAPITPSKKEGCDCSGPPKTQSSGSPLKLFDKYDTFTNDRLVRRLSQFEEGVEDSDGGAGSADDVVLPNLPRQASSPAVISKSQPAFEVSQYSDRRVSSFGDGVLDGHAFSDEGFFKGPYTEEYIRRRDQQSQPNNAELSIRRRMSSSKSAETCPKEYHLQRGDQYRRASGNIDEVDSDGYNSGHSRGSRGGINNKVPFSQNGMLPFGAKINVSKRKAKGSTESPVRNSPKAKRQRTLVADSIQSPRRILFIDNDEQVQSQLKPAVAGKKRKDARYDKTNDEADPKVIASRRMLQPRTPSQGQNKLKTKSMTSTLPITQTDDLEQILDTSTQILAEELANFAVDVAEDFTGDQRKPSVTTADFFNEANLIMQHIRAKGRLQLGLERDTQTESLDDIEESRSEGSTLERFSRPPSRERSRVNKPKERQLDPRVVSYLKKYEDTDESSVSLASSIGSLKLRERHGPSNASDIHSDPPNLRIGDRHSVKIKDPSDPPTRGTSGHGENEACSPPPLSVGSSERSVPTGSSKSSSNKTTIGPEKVAHLLPDNVAGMTYDHSRQIWTKRKTSESLFQPPDGESDDMEEDPFNEIPDLSVDELEELKSVTLATAASNTTSKLPYSAGVLKPHELGQLSVSEAGSNSPDSSRGGSQVDSVFSKASRLQLNGSNTENRTTSLEGKSADGGDDTDLNNDPKPVDQPEEVEEVEHEISILEGRDSRPLKLSERPKRQPRVFTVSFSSPLVSRSQGQYEDEESDLDLASSPERAEPKRVPKKTIKAPHSHLKSSKWRRRGRRSSLSSQVVVAYPIPSIEEHNGIGIPDTKAHGDERKGLILNTPNQTRELSNSTSLQIRTIRENSYSPMNLPSLADFSVHQPDEVPPFGFAFQIQKDRTNSEDFENAKKEVTKTLTDVMPFDPFWETAQSLNLQGRDIHTLYPLNELCNRIAELNVSNNKLSQLHGVPSSVRTLEVRHNRLTELTMWNSLQNLQYVDVSANMLKSLAGFEGLLHLRVLVAENNYLESMQGVFKMEGLIGLKLCGNRISVADFNGAKLRRLEELDLRDNQISKVSCLERLPAIARLNLDNNKLAVFDPLESDTLPPLRSLSLANNDISYLDITCFPNLRELNIQDNHITNIIGLASLKDLQTLSWRKQNIAKDDVCGTIKWDACYETRNLFLSGNRMPTFIPHVSFLDLHHLELASVGLQELTPDFGTKLPNLRHLNLNYNALKNIQPLLGIQLLENLHLVGNRISRLRFTSTVISRLGNSLKELDLRGNPLAIGFYAQASEHDSREMQLVLSGQSASKVINAERLHLADAARYLAAPVKEEADEHFRRCLDEETSIRRRVYEILFWTSSTRLEVFDGRRVKTLGTGIKDRIYHRMVELGVIKE